MKGVIASIVVVLAVGCAGPPEPAAAFPERVIDLSWDFAEDTIYWPTEPGFALEQVSYGYTPGGYFYAANRLCAAEHGGTHLDAPVHFFEGRHAVDEIPIERLVGAGVVIDVRAQVEADTDYLVSRTDFEVWEAEHGPLPDGAIVLLRTGHGAYWPDRVRYMGTDARGAEGVAALHFPGLDPDAASWLAAERAIGAIGIDTPSIDHGPSTTFDAHVRLFEANIPALENVARLEELPPSGFWVVALPISIRGGSGAPARIVALLD